ncbi:heterokaryon incompatibility protein-domain-containing protein [Halenospora varia]|nr:heterokaryon incompatibility protein-domain-containing protein [Halenospora varia]
MAQEILCLIAPEDDPSAKFCKTRDYDMQANTFETLLTARKWFLGQILPKRFLSVGDLKYLGDDLDMKIVPTQDLTLNGSRQVEYAILSYCWGGPQAHATIIKNIEERSKGFSSLRALGIQYLWVDALCIIQDSNEDEIHGISSMGEFYAGACVTIIAKSAKSAAEGFLNFQKEEDFRSIPYLCPDGRWRKLNLRMVSLQREPTEQRAWIMQEEFLSPFQLRFGRSTVSWHCADAEHASLSEMVRPSFVSQRITLVGREVISSSTSSKNLMTEENAANCKMSHRDLQDSTQRTAAGSWIGVLEEYTAREMTEQGLTYLAGVWEEWLLFGLCWHIQASGQTFDDFAPFQLRPKPECYRAPFWSWATIDGRCEWNHPVIPGHNHQLPAIIINCYVELTDVRYPYGAVTHGRLQVSGTVFKCDFMPEFDIEQRISLLQSLYRIGEHSLTVSIIADSLESWPAITGKIWLLLLAQRDLYLTEVDDQKDKATGELLPPAAYAKKSILEQSLRRQQTSVRKMEATDESAEKLSHSEGLILQAVENEDEVFRRIEYWKGIALRDLLSACQTQATRDAGGARITFPALTRDMMDRLAPVPVVVAVAAVPGSAPYRRESTVPLAPELMYWRI